jgi:hypothetical protein
MAGPRRPDRLCARIGPTEHLIAAMRRALKRAGPAPRSEGALMWPVAQGAGVAGG